MKGKEIDTLRQFTISFDEHEIQALKCLTEESHMVKERFKSDLKFICNHLLNLNKDTQPPEAPRRSM